MCEGGKLQSVNGMAVFFLYDADHMISGTATRFFISVSWAVNVATV